MCDVALTVRMRAGERNLPEGLTHQGGGLVLLRAGADTDYFARHIISKSLQCEKQQRKWLSKFNGQLQ